MSGKLKMISSLMLVVAMVGITVGSSVAVFSDQGKVEGNTVSMGTLDLTLNRSAGKPYTVTNAYPGWMSPTWEYVDIYNTGTLPFEAYMSFAKTSGSDDLYNYLTVTLKYVGWDSDCTNGDAGEKPIYSGLIRNFPQTLVSSPSFWHQGSDSDGSGPGDNINPNITMRVCQKIGVHQDASNGVMGATVTFSEIVDAMQDND